MRILSIGAGAISGHYGACLVRGGRDVTFQVPPRVQTGSSSHPPQRISPSPTT